MVSQKAIRRHSSQWAMCLALCYLWLAGVASFHHAHVFPGSRPPARSATRAVCCPSAQNPQHTAVQSTEVEAEEHCPVCDWQAQQLAEALPPFTLAHAFQPGTDAPALAPRAPSVALFSASARAPPVSL